MHVVELKDGSLIGGDGVKSLRIVAYGWNVKGAREL